MNPLFLLSGIGMIIVALASIIYWKKKSKIAFRFFLLGAIAWIIAVALKTAWAVSLNKPILNFLESKLPANLSGPLSWSYIGLLTGIFECGIVLGFIYLLKGLKEVNWKESVGFGIGFGAFEALLLGIASFVVTLLAILIPEQLPKELLEGLPQLQSLWVIPAPIIERISTLFIHIFSVVLILYAFKTKEWKWFWLSFWYKTAVDSVAAYVHLAYGVEKLTVMGLWILELIILLFAIVGLWGLINVHKKWKNYNY